MIIKNFTESSAPLNLQTLEVDRRLQHKFTNEKVTEIFILKLPEFFSTKDFGSGTREIFYYERCLMQQHNNPIKIFYAYKKKLKKIECVVDLDYETALKLDVHEFAKYLALKYIERSEDFAKLKIKDFDHAAYMADLKHFFRESYLIQR